MPGSTPTTCSTRTGRLSSLARAGTCSTGPMSPAASRLRASFGWMLLEAPARALAPCAGEPEPGRARVGAHRGARAVRSGPTLGRDESARSFGKLGLEVAQSKFRANVVATELAYCDPGGTAQSPAAGFKSVSIAPGWTL